MSLINKVKEYTGHKLSARTMKQIRDHTELLKNTSMKLPCYIDAIGNGTTIGKEKDGKFVLTYSNFNGVFGIGVVNEESIYNGEGMLEESDIHAEFIGLGNKKTTYEKRKIYEPAGRFFGKYV